MVEAPIEATPTDFPRSSEPPPLAGRRILVVEDEPVVAMALEDMLFDLGYIVVGPALNMRTAMALASSEALDGAILDINLNDDLSFPIAETLTARAVPYLFATGYGGQGLIPPFEDAPVLAKPYSSAALEEILSHVLSFPRQGHAARSVGTA